MGVDAPDRRASGRRKDADLSVSEVAEKLGVHYNTALALIRSHKLVAYRVNKLWRITLTALQEFRQQRRDAEREAERH